MENNSFYFFMLHHYPALVPPAGKRRVRRSLKAIRDPLARSLRDHTLAEAFNDPCAWRTGRRGPDDDESITDYVIVRDDGLTDDDMADVERELRLDICSSYDCTGRLFTAYFAWKRLPCGMAIVHRKCLDV